MDGDSGLEAGLERALFAARWLLAPMYLGLVAALGLVVVVFGRELLGHLGAAAALSDTDVILAALTLIDLTLVANLLLIVLFSGWENFVGRMDVGPARPAWMGAVDFGTLKIKLVASIVAISGIALLKRFMEIGDRPVDDGTARELLWLTAIHLVFVLSGVLLALMDRLGAKGGRKPRPAGGPDAAG